MKLFNYFRTLARRQRIGEYVERQYAAAAGGRLTSDWMAGGSSEDTELAGSLETMRNRSRQMIRDNPHAANLQRIIEDNVDGTGIGLQCLVIGADGKPDLLLPGEQHPAGHSARFSHRLGVGWEYSRGSAVLPL